MRRYLLAALAIALDLVATPSHAEAESHETEPDKSGYTFRNPTPRDLMREMSTDRPDQTESAYTVDAGHFQLEMDLVRAFIESGSDTDPAYVIAPVNFKLGLTNRMDIQFVLDTFVWTEDASGVGEFATRLKINLWGNDGGRTALAVMPFVKLPLPASDLRNGKLEGGLIFPLAADLGAGFGLGAMTELDLVAIGPDYETEWINTITVGHDLTTNLGMYIEFVAVTGSAPGLDWEGQADLGFTYAFSPDLRMDWGCNFAVTDGPPDYIPWVGLSARF
jgi:Putative MetA-pathway of phenol degradation